MFSVEYGFGYSVQRKGSVIEIWINAGPESEFLSLDLEESEVSKTDTQAADMVVQQRIKASRPQIKAPDLWYTDHRQKYLPD
jgi:hypothetical protein